MFRVSRTLFYAAQSIKATTGITGLAPHPDPLPALKSIYGSTLTSLSALPATSVYRQAAEALTKHRLAIVERAGNDISSVEAELGSQVEVVIEEAQSEQNLAGKIVEWKVWEPLEEQALPNQWRYFDPTGDSL